MNINGFELPFELASDVAVGGHQLSQTELSRLKDMLNRVESPLPRFFTYEEIVRENRLWLTESAGYYLGQKNESAIPGDVDPQRTLIIGQAEPDSPIALDYRSKDPRVIYLGDVNNCSCWIEIGSDYATLIEEIKKEVH
jgi:hypothetical protein